MPIYLTQGTLNSSRIDPIETRVIIFQNNTTFEIGELAVHAQRTIHDATDPACFVIEARDGTRVGIASDLGYTDAPVIGHLRDCDGLFFESNHDLDMLRLGTYPWSLKRRIMSRFGHLSNDDSIIALQRMLSADTKTLCMIHLSEKNNTEGIVREVTTRMIDRMGAQLEFAIAKQAMPTKKFDIRRRSVRRAVEGQMALF